MQILVILSLAESQKLYKLNLVSVQENFLEIVNDELGLIRNPFIVPVEKIPDSLQNEFLEIKADSCARDLFNEKSITEFWPLMYDSYPKVTKKAIQGILPFVSTYLCKSEFSTLLQILTKKQIGYRK